MYRHADTHKLALVRCRGVRRMHLNSNMSACEQASVSQFGSSAHGSLLRAKFQFVTFGSRDRSDVWEEDSLRKSGKEKSKDFYAKKR